MKKEADDCGTCTDFKDWFSKTTEESKKQKGSPNTTSEPRKNEMSSKPTTVEQSYYEECPLFRNQLGNATWKYLHTMAAYYPAKPSEEQKNRMTQFIDTFAETFPCTHCAADFQKE
jgi:FAD-linked sulfhydryl oxidase